MSLNDFVVDALVRTPPYQHARLWTVENHEKYSTLVQPESGLAGDHRFNHEIFLLMRALNEQGVGQNGLCADAQGQGALTTVIGNVAERLAALSSGRRVHYVELGPEPIKSACLLKRMAETSSAIRYTAIDINQTSEAAMSDAVRPIVPGEGSFNYIAADYRTVTHDDLHHDQELTLITLLGFQEGNELPVSTGRLIRNLAGNATYILSEMQVYEVGLENTILGFYANPCMLQFSRMVALQQGFTPVGEHAAILLPLRILDEPIHVVVTLQPVQRLGQRGYLLTNICLKYTPEQFRRIRAQHCNCSVVDEFASGDGSVRYQIAKYLQ
ncbi:hypothetical protein CCOS865_05223 [Pseudomonas reidholzensis]|uniref:Histidine-specific methyltransferase SAM-dependent domain-containing protein n=1 Tax=Pseudomonas reidholzensis TaxID=1785162 RepID=A0A383S0X8_9PSED|nr:hypothetical protein [Pseudomonas reidholzensis]SYX92929.1 hypothetical protein CCOS865_05223 [Pseudomonas reidholzensis]